MDLQNSLMAALEMLVLEHLHDGRFVVRFLPPHWFRRMGFDRPQLDEPLWIEEISAFLEAFLPEAEKAWAGEGAIPLNSVCWTEKTTDGEELHLEATALSVNDSPLLVITRSEAHFLERCRVLGRARELRLAHDALSCEIERKDVLIHCIIHDLGGPLNSILGTLSLLEELQLDSRSAELIQVALKAALRQRGLIREILDIFAAERSAVEVSYNDFATAPNVCAVIAQVVNALRPLSASRGVRLEGTPEAGFDPPCKVIGDERRLTRVLFNLIDNAIRFTPAGKSVRVSLHDEPKWVFVTVDDEGPGVSPSIVLRLFEKFARGPDPAACTGLGLYFCRITVEHWGGAIGYERRLEGGARFWFRLRRIDAPRVESEKMQDGGPALGEAAARGR
jgi:signal transduction histidine kinase